MVSILLHHERASCLKTCAARVRKSTAYAIGQIKKMWYRLRVCASPPSIGPSAKNTYTQNKIHTIVLVMPLATSFAGSRKEEYENQTVYQ